MYTFLKSLLSALITGIRRKKYATNTSPTVTNTATLSAENLDQTAVKSIVLGGTNMFIPNVDKCDDSQIPWVVLVTGPSCKTKIKS